MSYDLRADLADALPDYFEDPWTTDAVESLLPIVRSYAAKQLREAARCQGGEEQFARHDEVCGPLLARAIELEADL